MERVPFCGRKLQSNTGRCSGFRCGAPSMVPVESMCATICFHLLRRVAELDQRLRHGVVDDLDHAAADQLLVLHQRQIGLDAGGVAIHHEADGAGGRDHRRLRVAEAVLRAQFVSVVPALLGRLEHVARNALAVDAVHRIRDACGSLRGTALRSPRSPGKGPTASAIRALVRYAWPHMTAVMAPA